MQEAPCIGYQISLGEEHYRFLVAEAQQLGVSLAEVVRRLIAGRMTERQDAEDPLDALAGFVEGDGSSVAENHDRYLYADPRD
jgi:L-amino acid N-acyltransferase YncA